MSIKETIEKTIKEVLKRELSENFSQKEVLTTKDAALYMRVSHQWLEIGRVKGYGPPFIKLSRLVRYRKSDLDQWMDSHKQFNTTGV